MPESTTTQQLKKNTHTHVVLSPRLSPSWVLFTSNTAGEESKLDNIINNKNNTSFREISQAKIRYHPFLFSLRKHITTRKRQTYHPQTWGGFDQKPMDRDRCGYVLPPRPFPKAKRDTTRCRKQHCRCPFRCRASHQQLAAGLPCPLSTFSTTGYNQLWLRPVAAILGRQKQNPKAGTHPN